jgi:hypothetical protein
MVFGKDVKAQENEDEEEENPEGEAKNLSALLTPLTMRVEMYG